MDELASLSRDSCMSSLWQQRVAELLFGKFETEEGCPVEHPCSGSVEDFEEADFGLFAADQ